MDSKDKKQLNIFKSVQISKENREKYFKVEKGIFNVNNNKNINTALNKKSRDGQDISNFIFITHKNNINEVYPSKKGNNHNNNELFLNNINNRNKKMFYNNNNGLNDINNVNVIDEKVYKTKLNLVYFESIINLCNHLNQNFNQLIQNEKIVNINEYLKQMYQNLQILNKKIQLITNKQTYQVNKQDYEIINILLNHLYYMNDKLSNNISKNIVNIYSNLNNFYSSCNCSL